MPSTSCTLPFKMKKDMIEAYLLMERSQEEQELLATEMRNALDFWNICAKNLQESVDSMRSRFHPSTAPLDYRFYTLWG